MENKIIIHELFKLQDLQYRDFAIKLIPTVNPATVIGVRTPALRSFAKQLKGTETASVFISNLPHKYYDENQLHAFILSEMKDYDLCIEAVDRFLPWIDNWATCDQLSPKIFKKYLIELPDPVMRWIQSDHCYTVRFAIGMLMKYFLDGAFDLKYPIYISKMRSDEYYINMMIAWYFATALAKQYDHILPFLEQKLLANWTHNKAIQKAVESYRLTNDQKTYLKTLKLR